MADLTIDQLAAAVNLPCEKPRAYVAQALALGLDRATVLALLPFRSEQLNAAIDEALGEELGEASGVLGVGLA